MRNKIVDLEAQLKRAQLDLERVKTCPGAGFSQREEFLIGEIDLISQQFHGMAPFLPLTVVQVVSTECCLLMQTSALIGEQSRLE
jgi:hypothetical protein